MRRPQCSPLSVVGSHLTPSAHARNAGGGANVPRKGSMRQVHNLCFPLLFVFRDNKPLLHDHQQTNQPHTHTHTHAHAHAHAHAQMGHTTNNVDGVTAIWKKELCQGAWHGDDTSTPTGRERCAAVAAARQRCHKQTRGRKGEDQGGRKVGKNAMSANVRVATRKKRAGKKKKKQKKKRRRRRKTRQERKKTRKGTHNHARAKAHQAALGSLTIGEGGQKGGSHT